MVDGLEVRLRAPGFDAGKVEEGVDEFEQSHAVAVRETPAPKRVPEALAAGAG